MLVYIIIDSFYFLPKCFTYYLFDMHILSSHSSQIDTRMLSGRFIDSHAVRLYFLPSFCSCRNELFNELSYIY